jgi:hypothetical protein
MLNKIIPSQKNMFTEISQHKPELKSVLGWHGTLNKKDNSLKNKEPYMLGCMKSNHESYQFLLPRSSVERWSQLSLNVHLLSGSSLLEANDYGCDDHQFFP